MGQLRKAFNRGGKDHYINPGHRKPFESPITYSPKFGYSMKDESQYPKFKMHRGPMAGNIMMMAFERALECGGWRTTEFIEFIRRYWGDMPVELLQAIEGRLTPVINKSSGHVMTEESYREWYNFCKFLREFLYDL